MSLTDQQLSELYEKYLQNRCSPEELQSLVEVLGAEAPVFRQELVTGLFDKTWEALEVFPGRYPVPGPPAEIPEAPVVTLATRPRRRRWVAAAAVLLLLGGAAWWGLGRRQAAPAVASAAEGKNDVPPGYSKARLTLADGSVISLDSAHTGMLTKQGGTSLVNAAAGQL
ncbi:MAG: hypothetical protein JST39_02640, partial [Bacteroidetes bacterium]|nr:hypothetical protein [Bacteroidota bacterium]